MTIAKENSIVQVVCETAEIHSLRPYVKPTTKTTGGSGVIVDSANGLIITNAHVVGNSTFIQVFSPITGKMPLRCELVSIIRDKDISLIRIIAEDLQHLLKMKTPDQLDAQLVNHLTIPQGAQLFAAGFPLGTRLLQITSGCFSGLNTSDSFTRITQTEDSYARDATYIATSAGLNFGMSGGGLFSQDGYLVGIITAGLPSANQIGYAIPSRVLYANYLLMRHNLLPRIPTFDFRWTNIDDATFNYVTKERKTKRGCQGILIRKILDDSIFYGVLEKGDLLYEIKFFLSTITPDCLKRAEEMENDGRNITACIEAHADVTLHDQKTKAILFDRKFSISEMSDYIMYGSPITLLFVRNGENKEKTIPYTYRKTQRIRGVYPLLENINWMIIGGVCIQDTTLNAIAECPRYKYIDENEHYDKFLFTPSIIITYVSPSSTIGSLNLFNEGDILTHINGEKVTKLEEVKELLKKKPKTIRIESDRGQLTVLDLSSS